MTAKQQMEYNEAVIASAKDWISGKSTINGVEELVIIAEYYKVYLPKYTVNFICSENPNHVKATGAYKALLSLMERLKKAIIKK